MEDERIAVERKFERKIDIITREASRREYDMSQDEIQDLMSQVISPPPPQRFSSQARSAEELSRTLNPNPHITKN